MKKMTYEERVTKFVDSFVVAERGCLIWQRAKTSKGYGSVWLTPERSVGVHRAAYELYYGRVPLGSEIDHICGNRACGNPLHLEAVTHVENVRRGHRRSAVKYRIRALTRRCRAARAA